MWLDGEEVPPRGLPDPAAALPLSLGPCHTVLLRDCDRDDESDPAGGSAGAVLVVVVVVMHLLRLLRTNWKSRPRIPGGTSRSHM